MRVPGSDFAVRKVVLFALPALLFLALSAGAALGAGVTPTPYRASGSIAGTGLLYDKLKIDGGGRVTITISNPGRTGESFVANFSFYTEKGVWLAGFSIEGFAGRVSDTSYALDFPDHGKLKKAAYMKVLGRAGRTSDN